MHTCPVNDQGQHANSWIELLLQECAYTQSDIYSVLFGYLSIVCWLFAQLPQLWTNWKNGTAESLSLMFVFTWLFGDVMNLAGCLLTNQLPFQIRLAAYFVVVDTVLFAQSLWYRGAAPSRVQQLISSEQSLLLPSQTCAEPTQSGESSLIDGYGAIVVRHTPYHRTKPTLAIAILTSLMFLITLSLLIYYGTLESWGLKIPSGVSLSAHSSSLSSLSEHSNVFGFTWDSYTIGRIMAWICTAFYLSSRPPQIIWNARRKTCRGLSTAMFIGAALGNLTYTISIIVKSTDFEFLLGSLPYLLGSGGTIFFDVIILGQYVIYDLL
ncbi:hypothetical protein BASA61_006067 [Batrachochytrium salamandrivorans]|nr:hypothetical protein BASA62_003365 [Batrachochytrium salamandrivorans]KAH6588162.1 hypothetical protein BASA61_006067 [Batrachochytrium salamandrivorans]KAH9254336.1 hypothetical protein BASA81_007618 [Batrachochytrium salamandrivorans]KAH9265697.1 hypothetical protein BASA83_010985 [Batrachochytrium salamandrivorans]